MRTFTIGIIGWLAAVIGLSLLAGQAAAQPDGMDEKVSARAVAQHASVKPGGRLVIAVEMTHRQGWHSWPEIGVALPRKVAEIADANRTSITLRDNPPSGIKLEGVQYPAPHDGVVVSPDGDGTIKVPLYSDTALAYARIEVAKDAPAGDIVVPLNLFYQACNDKTCAFPTDVALDVTIKIVPAEASEESKGVEPALFSGFDASTWGSGGAGAPAPASGGSKAPLTPAGGGAANAFAGGPIGLVTMFLSAVLGGFILNLMPCVLPVIPIKILSLSKSAGNPRRCFYLGCVASAGVIAAWMAAGLIAAVLGVATNQLYTHWWFNVGIGLLIAVMALGMLGLFVVNLPQSVYMVNPTTDSAGGSFIFGVFTVVLALPCVAPFAGAVSSWALSQPAPVVLLAFFGIGLGMALPYLVLSAKPSWINKIPRTGPASELVKHVMGGLMLAIAVYFLGSGIAGVTPAYPKNLHWWVLTAIAVLTAAWLLYQGFKVTRSAGKRVMVAVLALLLAGGPAYMTWNLVKVIEWPDYSREAFDAARARGDVVVVDFTAVWCISCQERKASVLSKRPVEAATTQKGVTRMLADVTVNTAPGKKLMKEIGENGIPLLLVYKPGDEIPRPHYRANWYTIDEVVKAIDEAKAARTAWLAANHPELATAAPAAAPGAPAPPR